MLSAVTINPIIQRAILSNLEFANVPITFNLNQLICNYKFCIVKLFTKNIHKSKGCLTTQPSV